MLSREARTQNAMTITSNSGRYPHGAMPTDDKLAWYKKFDTPLPRNSQDDVTFNFVQQVVEENDDEDEFAGDALDSFLQGLKNIIFFLFGSVTMMLMLVVLGIWFGALAGAYQGAHIIQFLGLYYGIFVAVAVSITVIRHIWVIGILRPYCMDKSFIVAGTKLLDPELGLLVLGVSSILVFNITCDRVPNASTYYSIMLGVDISIPEDAYKYTILGLSAILLWAIKNAVAKMTIFSLMLEFWQNFNEEVAELLKKYSIIRRMNAACEKLVSGGDEARSSTVENFDRVHIGDYAYANSRELSKAKLRLIAGITRSPSKDMDSGSATLNYGMDDHGGQQIHLSPSVSSREHRRSKLVNAFSYKNSDTTKLYTVEFSAREIPYQLDKSFIRSVGHSKLDNYLALTWLKEQHVVMYHEAVRYELHSMEEARRIASNIYETLVELQAIHAEVEAQGLELDHRGKNAYDFAVEIMGIRQADNDSKISMKTVNDFPASPGMRLNEGMMPVVADAPEGRTALPPNSEQFVIPTDDEVHRIADEEIQKLNENTENREAHLTCEFLELFMSSEDARNFYHMCDTNSIGYLTLSDFTNAILTIYKLRKQIIHSLEAQEGIERVFSRMIEYVLLSASALIYCVLLGINTSTIIVTGVSLVSGAAVVLSVVYTDFIQSMILLLFLNPFRIGDRMRIDDQPMYVRKISTYFTEFETLHGRPQYIANKDLAAMKLINESRCKNATYEFIIRFSERTSPSQYSAFSKIMESYIQSRPQEFVRNSYYIHISAVESGHYLEITIWATHNLGWSAWREVRTAESSMMHFALRVANVLGMYYKLPIQRWENSTQSSAKYPDRETTLLPSQHYA